MHPDVVRNEPGQCPKCGMDLVEKEKAPATESSDTMHMPGMQHDAPADGKIMYTCPMHPDIVRDQPGTCPVCHMDLVKKKSVSPSGAVMPVDGELDFLLKPTYEYVLSSVKTLPPERKTIPLQLSAPGYLSYDPRLLNAVSARFGGRIERLYVRYPYQQVHKGQRILDIYSPEIVTAQQELVFLLENDPANTVLQENARKRLLLLGLTTDQVRQLETSRKPFLSLPVFSPYAGLIVDGPATPPGLAMPGGGMNNTDQSPVAASTASATAADELALKEGMYVQPGQRLFNLQSLATVWAVLEFYPADISMVKAGQPVSIRIESFENPFRGKIDYVEPLYGPGGKNLRARVYLANSGGRLKPGALLQATVQAGNRTGLWIPASATLDLGKSNIVFIKKDGVFRTKAIQTGTRSDGMVQVAGGLAPEEEIAENARFLMDSESFVKLN